VCAFGALSVPAFAKEKPKLVFGEFTGSFTGKNLTTEPAALKGHGEVEEMTLGQYKFGKNGEVCQRELVAKGEVEFERELATEPFPVFGSNALNVEVTFRRCNASAHEGGFRETKPVTFTLDIGFKANRSAEIGESGGLEIVKPSVVTFKGPLRQCVVEIPSQTLPLQDEKNENKEYEAATYEAEAPEAVENWEKSKLLKARYPSGFKERLGIGIEFKKIVSYVKPEKHCEYEKGEEGKFITEEGNPHKGWVEFNNGKIIASLEELEIKNGELSFVPPA
jgi:hypothetical protein